MTAFTIEDPLFKTEPLFIGNCTAEQANAYLRKRFGVEGDIAERTAGMMLTFSSRPPWRVVWVAKLNRHSARNVAELAHEIFHLVTRICADRGIPIVAHHPDGLNGDETAAFLMEFFMMRAWKHLRP